MTHRRHSTRRFAAPMKMFGHRTATAAVAICAAVALDSTPAQAAEPPAAVADDVPSQATCRVHAVLASKDGDGSIPKNLAFMREWLTDEPYNRFKSFHLLDSKKVSLSSPKPTRASFKTGHKMQLSLLGGDAKRLKLRLDLTQRDGKKSLGATNYSIADNGLFFIEGGQHTSGEVTGRIFWAIQCARR